MTADVWFAVVTGWAIMTLIVGHTSWALSDESLRIPDGAEPAIGVTAGLLWPATVAIFIGWIVWRCGRGLARSFAVLWNVSIGEWLLRRAARISVPRATARRTK